MVMVCRSGAGGDRDQARLGEAITIACRSVRRLLLAASAALVLLLVGEASVAFLPVNVSIEVRGADGVVAMDGSQHAVTVPDRIGGGAHIRFEQPGPVEREYQLD